MGSSGRSIAFADHALQQRLAPPAGRLGLLPRPTFRRFLIGPPAPQLAECPLALHLALQDPERRVDVVVSDKNLHLDWAPFLWLSSMIRPSRTGSGWAATGPTPQLGPGRPGRKH